MTQARKGRLKNSGQKIIDKITSGEKGISSMLLWNTAMGLERGQIK